MYKNNNKSNTDELPIKCDNFLSDPQGIDKKKIVEIEKTVFSPFIKPSDYSSKINNDNAININDDINVTSPLSFNNANSSPNNMNTNLAQINLTEQYYPNTDNENTTVLNIPVNQDTSSTEAISSNMNEDSFYYNIAANILEEFSISNDNSKLSLDNITDMDYVPEDMTHNNQPTIKKLENLFMKRDGFSPDWKFLENNEKIRKSLYPKSGSCHFPKKRLRDLSSFISTKDANGNTFLHYYILKKTFSYSHLMQIVIKLRKTIGNLTIKNNKGDTFLHLLIKYRKINSCLLNFLDKVHQKFPTIFDEKNDEGLTVCQYLENAKLSKKMAKKRENLLTKIEPQSMLLSQKNIMNNHLNTNNDNDDMTNTLNDNSQLSLDNITDMDYVPEDMTHNNQRTIKRLEKLYMLCDSFSPDWEFLKNDDLAKGLLNGSKRFTEESLDKLLTYASTKDTNGNTPLHYYIFRGNITYPRLRAIIDGLGETISNLTIKNNKGDTFLHAFIKYKLPNNANKSPYIFLTYLHRQFPTIFEEKDANNVDAYSLLEKTEVVYQEAKMEMLDNIGKQRKLSGQQDISNNLLNTNEDYFSKTNNDNSINIDEDIVLNALMDLPDNVNTNPAQVNLTEQYYLNTDNGNTTVLNIPVNSNISFHGVNLNNINEQRKLLSQKDISNNLLNTNEDYSSNKINNNNNSIKLENFFIKCKDFSPKQEFIDKYSNKYKFPFRNMPYFNFLQHLNLFKQNADLYDSNHNTFLHYYTVKNELQYPFLKGIVVALGCENIKNLTIKNNKGDTFLHLLIKYRKINGCLLNFLDKVHQKFPTIFNEKNAEGLTVYQCLKNAKLSKGIAEKRKNLLTKIEPKSRLLSQKNIMNNHLNTNNDNDDMLNTLNDNNKLSLDNITDMDSVPKDMTHNNQLTIKRLEKLYMLSDSFSPDWKFLKNDDLVKGLLNSYRRSPEESLGKLLTYASTKDANGNTPLHYYIFKYSVNYPQLKAITDELGKTISNLTIKNNKGDTFLHAFIKYKLPKSNGRTPYDFLIELHQKFPTIFNEKDANNLDVYSLLEKTEVFCKKVKMEMLAKINEQRKSLNQEDASDNLLNMNEDYSSKINNLNANPAQVNLTEQYYPNTDNSNTTVLNIPVNQNSSFNNDVDLNTINDNHQDLSKNYSIQQTQQFIGSKRLHTQIIEDISNQHLEIDCPPRKKMRLEKPQNNNNTNLNSYFFMNNNKNSISPDVSNSSNCIEDNFQNTDEDIEINNNETIQYNSPHFFQQSNDNVTAYIEQLQKYVTKYNLTEIVEVKPKNGTRYYLKFKMMTLETTSFKNIENFQLSIKNTMVEMNNVCTPTEAFGRITGLVFKEALFAKTFLKQLKSSMANIEHQSAPASKLA